MKSIRTLQIPFVLALAAALGATPALAQGKGKQKKEERERTEQVRQLREDRRYEDRRDDDRRDRWEDEVRLQRREGGPPFCRNGKGHPVHGRRWCVEKGFGLGGDGRYDDRRYEDRRYEDRRYEDRRYDDYGRYGSYEEAHRAFHRDHDRICRERAAQRPFDVRWQLQVRGECKAEHDRWHAQMGRRH